MRSEPGSRTQGDPGLALKSFAVGQMPSLLSYIFRDFGVTSACHRPFHRGAGQGASGSPNSCVLQEETSTAPLLSQFLYSGDHKDSQYTSQPHSASVGGAQ